MTILDELLGNLSRSEFLAQHYLKRPLARPGGGERMAAAFTWPRVQQLLTQPGVDYLAARLDKVWKSDQPPTEEQLRLLLAEGYTLRIRRAERHDPLLQEVTREFQQAFGGRVDIHIYCTPAGHHGLNWHYDAEEVFVLQTLGSKSWWLRKNTVNPWPLVETMPENMHYERELMPAMRCDLRPGDWLYVPNGYWHRTQAGEESISLSIGIFAPTALDVLDFLRKQLLSSLLWRQRLPAPGTASGQNVDELLLLYRELFQELGQDLAKQFSQEDFLRAFVQEKRKLSGLGTAQ